MWPLGGTCADGTTSRTHIVGSFEGDEDDEERCDIVLMEDEYMSAR